MPERAPPPLPLRLVACAVSGRPAGLLLSAQAAAQPCIISLPLSERGCGVYELPELDCMVDLARLRGQGLIGDDETTYE